MQKNAGTAVDASNTADTRFKKTANADGRQHLANQIHLRMAALAVAGTVPT